NPYQIFDRRDTFTGTQQRKTYGFFSPYGVRGWYIMEENRIRNHQVKFRLSQEELDQLNKKILKSKLSKQDFFLKLIKEKEILVIEELPKLILELNRIGINLNQLTKKVNSKEKLGILKKIDLNRELKINSDALKSILNTIKDIFS
ncbi:mobilisation protein (MobC), partial [Cetobacterium ceti]